MPSIESFLAEYENRHEEDLLELWGRRNDLVPEARAALESTLRARGGGESIDAIAAPPAEPEEALPHRLLSPNARWVLKFYGGVAPWIALGDVRKLVGPLVVAPLMMAGYWLAVWWLARAQRKSPPSRPEVTVAGFLALHAVVMFATFWVCIIAARLVTFR